MSWKVTTLENLKSEEMERNQKAKRRKNKELAHTQTHTFSELTPPLRCYNRGKPRQTCNRTEKPSLRRQRIKCEEQKHVNLLCPKEFELLCCVFCRIVALTLPCYPPTSSIRDDKCDMTALLGELRRLQTENYLQRGVRQGEVCRDKTTYLNPLMSLCPASPEERSVAVIWFVFSTYFAN